MTCGDGMLTKTRTKVEAQFGGQPCEGESSIEESCLTEECPGNNRTLIYVLNITEQRISIKFMIYVKFVF